MGGFHLITVPNQIVPDMRKARSGAILVCVLFVLVFGTASVLQTTPVRVFAGENSVGSWMSGVLLVISATTTAVLALRRGAYPWFLFTVFFMLLAIDENFMIHEAMKRSLVFVSYERTRDAAYWLGELPVMIGGAIGVIAAWMMAKHLAGNIRWLVGVGVLFGSASIVIDILSWGVLWEDILKLLGELAVTCALVTELEMELPAATNKRPGQE